MSEQKIDIKELLRQNDLPVVDHKIESDIQSTMGKLPEGFDPSLVENASRGVEVDRADLEKHMPIQGGGISKPVISPDQMAAIEETMKEMEEQTKLAKKEFDEWNLKQAAEIKQKEPEVVNDDDSIYDDTTEEDELVDKERDVESFRKKYDEAVVIIDKSGMGQVVNFTDDERAKLEKVKKIKLEEVETVSLASLKRKRVKKGSAEKILQKLNTVKTTPIVLPISGITAVMKGCSPFELLGLVSGDANSVESLVSKWTLIHSKVETTSIGKLDFNTFLNSVSQSEYEIFVYGILCATYPYEDTFPLRCPECKTDIEHKYIVRTLLRAEEMSDRLKEAIKKTVDNSYTEESAKACFDSSLLNTTTTFTLPESGFVMSLGMQTAYEFIYDSVKAIDKLDKKYAQAAILSSTVETILTPDPDDEGAYLEVDDTEDKIKLIYNLSEFDLGILGAMINKLVEGMEFNFGLMDINCPNGKCKNHINTVPVDMDSILFHKYQQAMNTTIE